MNMADRIIEICQPYFIRKLQYKVFSKVTDIGLNKSMHEVYYMMVVAHNMMAENADRQFGIVKKTKDKSVEKLSSGYRINRAADDAAGLSISEKMRYQIRGLNAASRNIQDGISLCQVADGALTETHDILQRMNELSIQSANGTNTPEDRAYLQQEFAHLENEIDRIANNTTFNESIYPLKVNTELHTSIADLLPIPLTEGTITSINWSDHVETVDGVEYYPNEQYSYTGLYLDNNLSTNFLLKSGSGSFASVEILHENLTNILPVYGAGIPIESLRLSDLHVDNDGYIYTEINGVKCGISYSGGTIDDINSLYVHAPSPIGSYPFEYMKVRSLTDDDSNQQLPIKIQSGSVGNQYIELSLCNATASNLGITNINILTENNASQAIGKIQEAINKVSEFRSEFGAQQNRLEYAMKVDDNNAENTDAAESRIRDTDMAKEMVSYSKNNILEQVGQSVISQANQTQQSILSILG